MKIDPFADVKRNPVFRAESLSSLYVFIVTIGTFLPIKYYVPPTLFIYAGTYWLTYHFAEKKDLSASEAFTTLFLNLAQSSVVAYVIHFAVDEAFKFDGQGRLLDVMKD